MNTDGIILIDKPAGMTSHDVIDFIRKEFGVKKAGHAGTLDPFATGLLVVLLGAFTKKSVYFSGYDKEYDALARLGITTDTGDTEGKVVRERPVPGAENTRGIEMAFRSFLGEIEQVPPMYSAKKINGKKLYQLARKGLTVERKPKTVFIKSMEVMDISLPLVSFRVRCSKGTYIRQLACDIGEAIGCGAHLARLRRIAVGPFTLLQAVSIESLKNKKNIFHENIFQPA